MNTKIISISLIAAALTTGGFAGTKKSSSPAPAAKDNVSKPAADSESVPAVFAKDVDIKSSFYKEADKHNKTLAGVDTRFLDLDELFRNHSQPRIAFSLPPSPALPSEGHFHDEWYPSVTFRF